MTRLVEAVSQDLRLRRNRNVQDGVERIAKYIPAEILAFYTMWTQAAALLPVTSEEAAEGLNFPEGTLTIICIAGLLAGIVLTYFYFDRFFPNSSPASREKHRLISPIAFAIYGYTIWGAVDPSFFIPGIALMATAVLTLASFLTQPVNEA